MKLIFVIAISTILLNISAARAQDTKAPNSQSPPESKKDSSNANGSENNEKKATFTGIIQFVQGQPVWEKRPFRDTKEPIRFKSFLHPGDIINVPSGSHIKVVGNSRCKGVIYGQGDFLAPKQKESQTWEIVGGSARWICTTGQAENIRINGRGLTLQGGEIFYHKNQLLIRKGRVISQSGELLPNRSYRFKNGAWAIDQDPSDAHKLWTFNNELPAPLESLKTPEPKRKVSNRWMISAVLGGGGITHENSKHSNDGLNTHGARLMTNFLLKNHSLLASLTFFDSENERCKDQGFSNTPFPEELNCSRMENLSAEIGMRWNHERSWSFYTKLGLTQNNYNLNSFGPSSGGQPSTDPPPEMRVIYNGLSAALGIDKTFILETLGWGGFYMSAEVFVNKTIGTGETENFDHNTYIPDEYQPIDGALTQTGILISLGLMMQF